MKTTAAALVLTAALAARAGAEPETGDAPSFAGELGRRLSFGATADIETAYICRGYIWDARPYSAQSAALGVDLDPLGSVEASVWTYSALARSGHSAAMSRYGYAEADYLLRWYYDVDFAEGWRLRNGLGRQWVTNPGFRGGHTTCDWQALQVFETPWVTPYWRLRLLRRPVDETYWVVGVKRSFGLLENLVLTVDFFGDLGDSRHFANLYGAKPDHPGSRWRGGLQALSLVFRLDYHLMEHVDVFGFVGQFAVVSDDARDAVKAARGPEMRRELTYGGVGLSVGF